MFLEIYKTKNPDATHQDFEEGRKTGRCAAATRTRGFRNHNLKILLGEEDGARTRGLRNHNPTL